MDKVTMRGRAPKAVAALISGLPARRRRPDSWVVEDEEGHAVAEVLVRATRGMRVNLKHALPASAPPEVKRVFKPTGVREGAATHRTQWARYVYVTDENEDTVRQGLELVAHVA